MITLKSAAGEHMIASQILGDNTKNPWVLRRDVLKNGLLCPAVAVYNPSTHLVSSKTNLTLSELWVIYFESD